MAQEKSQLRRRFREERAERFAAMLTGGEGNTPNFMHLLEVPDIREATYVTSYLSVSNEPSTTNLNLALIAAGKTLLLPRVVHPNLEWVVWIGDSAMLRECRGLREPIGEAIAELSIIDAVIVPALQVDEQGYRMGQGGGYYDRSLPKMSGWKVGIIYAEELSTTSLPREAHDVALDAVATPTEVFRFR
ncbi:MAG: 5-formyltetrahydrofolate cyclo-ligase [Actinobacteria bacterium]|nr:5-formyltetrahydrofolate cyclo-ligase [Actinomycetota bacterium]